MAKRFEWASFLQDFGLLTLSFASGAPTVVLALWFYLRGEEPTHSGILSILMVFTICAAWGQWWKERKAHERDKARLIREYEARVTATSRDWNGDWHSLERKFEAYERPILATCYSDADRESWDLYTHDARDFQELCSLGVALLRTSPGVPYTLAEMSRARPDDYTIWLSFVRDRYGPWHVITTRNGQQVTATLTEIKDLKKFSVMACQHCAGRALPPS
jgi:hypothetical protein